MLWVIGALVLGGVGFAAFRYFGNGDGGTDTSTALLSDGDSSDSTSGSGDSYSSDSGSSDSGGDSGGSSE